jgi:hypothetical protein
VAVHAIPDQVVSVSELGLNGELAYLTKSKEVIFINLLGVNFTAPIITATHARPLARNGENSNCNDTLSAQCKHCGEHFMPPSHVSAAITNLVRDVGPDQSPCLELPREAWADPHLLTECPHCSQSLRFSPFITDTQKLQELAQISEQQLTFREDVRELIRLMRIVPLCWVAASVLAAVTDGGVWVSRILRAPVHGLIVGYPVFSIQAFRFIRPALTSKEKNLAALILAVVPIIFGLLVFSVWPFEWGWFYLLGNHARFDFNMLASKALLVGFILWVLIDVRVRPQTIDNRVRTILRWVFWGSILIITSPAAVTAGILLVLQILLFVLAMRSLLSRDLDR